MRRRTRPLTVGRFRAALVLAAALVSARAAGEAPVKIEPGDPLAIAAGGKADARVRVTVAPGFHVQANPASEYYLVPTELEIESAAGLRVRAPVYPPGKPFLVAGEKKPLSTYEGTFEIVVPLAADRAAPPGESTLRGRLRYQACDAKSCRFPAWLPVEIKARILPARKP